MEYLGCTVAELHSHLESQFTEGMNWGNQGANGWHIDHRKPCASFDLTDPEQQLMCFHYTNLQPMWATSDIALEYGVTIEQGNLNKSDSFCAETFDWVWAGTEQGWVHQENC
jgi:hypothetical protein